MLYVDPAIHKWKGSLWCHLTADSLEELHDFAINFLDLKREWFQDKTIPHYDLIEPKRKIAIEKGAIAIFLKRCAIADGNYLKIQRLNSFECIFWRMS